MGSEVDPGSGSGLGPGTISEPSSGSSRPGNKEPRRSGRLPEPRIGVGLAFAMRRRKGKNLISFIMAGQSSCTSVKQGKSYLCEEWALSTMFAFVGLRPCSGFVFRPGSLQVINRPSIRSRLGDPCGVRSILHYLETEESQGLLI